jgi:signal transduction histidine kinase/CheY-like chemotaxis protein
MNSVNLKKTFGLNDRLLLPAIVGLTTGLCALILWQRLITQQGVNIQAVTRTQASLVQGKMESELKARILPLQLLGERWLVHRDDADLQSDAALIENLDPVYHAIEWVDPAFQVRWMMPQRKDGADNNAKLSVDARRTALKAAVDSGRMTVTRATGPLPGQGDLEVCVPVYGANGVDGFVVGIFLYQDLLQSILEDVAHDYWVSVYDAGEKIYERSGPGPPPAVGDSAKETENVNFLQMAWAVKVWPKSELVAAESSPLPQVALAGGLLLAVLLAFVVYMAETSEFRARQVTSINDKLQTEIAGRERTEEALRHAQKMEAVGRLAGGVAHDFNNLLMVIRGNALLLLDRWYTDPDNPRRERLSEIVKTADRASAVTRQLLAFSRKQVLQPKVLDLNALIAQVAELLPPVVGADIRLDVDLDPGLGRVKADASQLEQIIMNLVFNARDAMPYGGDLTIRTANADIDDTWETLYPGAQIGPYVVVEVRDTGHGMDSETRSRIFEPFFTTKERDKGTGLGLASVYGTVDQSGGRISVTSEVGQGTTVQIYLPRVEESIESVPAPPGIHKLAAGNETILVVEDDDAVRRMTLEFLKISGYTVTEATNAKDAIQLIERHNGTIDLVITDVVMPGMKGRELGEVLSKLRPNLRMLYMSAHAEDIIIDHGMLDPGVAFIEKPFSPDELARKVREALANNA